MTKVLVPEPPQVEHEDLFAPGFRPLPEQEEQFTTGVMLIVRLVPLAASRKLTPMLA